METTTADGVFLEVVYAVVSAAIDNFGSATYFGDYFLISLLSKYFPLSQIIQLEDFIFQVDEMVLGAHIVTQNTSYVYKNYCLACKLNRKLALNSSTDTIYVFEAVFHLPLMLQPL